MATFYDMFSTTPKGRHDVYVCTNISCSLRGADEIYDRMLSAAGDDPDFHVKAFECLGACDIAPMASVDGEYVGPLEPADCERIVDDVKAGREVLPGKQLKKRKIAIEHWKRGLRCRSSTRRSTTPGSPRSTATPRAAATRCCARRSR